MVGAINGTAAGGGAQLVLACDLVVMADTARLIEVFVRRGIMPDAGGAYLLPRLVGLHRAKELMFLGDDVSAEAAERLGIANRVVPRGRTAIGRRRAGRASGAGTDTRPRHDEVAPQPILRVRSADGDGRGGLRSGVGERTPRTSREGMLSFMERRDPQFKGW